MKKTIFILVLIFIFCNCLICGLTFANSISSYNIYSHQSYSGKSVDYDKEKVMFIVDFSNSMNEYIYDGRKIDVALKALNEILPQIPKNAQVGLRIYGYRGGITPVDACLASKLVVPIGYNNFGKIYDALQRVAPTGMTPITYSIRQSLKNDFGVWQGEKRIIILTDGAENCDESPCTYAIKLMGQRKDVKIDVIAFTVNDVSANDQLRCATLMTNGKFYNAETYAQLVDSLKDSFSTEKSVEGFIVE